MNQFGFTYGSGLGSGWDCYGSSMILSTWGDGRGDYVGATTNPGLTQLCVMAIMLEDQ